MFKNKKIFILGMARSGFEVAKVLATLNNKITLNDYALKEDEYRLKELTDLGVEVILGKHPDCLFTKDYDYLIKNPGIKDNHKYVKKALSYKIPIINEVEVAYCLLPNKVDIIGITGSNGKTTTSTLIYEILKAAKKKVHLTGNIGYPLVSFIGKIKEGDMVVMEISIQQLFNIDKFKTKIAVLLNLFEAHLDLVKDYEQYKQIKKKVFNRHTKVNDAVLNKDNNEVMKLTNDLKSTKSYFSRKEVLKDGCYLKNKAIYYLSDKIIVLKDIKLKGNHNYENIMAAILVAKKYKISNEIIKKVLQEFKGIEHRLEYVTEIKGRYFYNDSKATNVKATEIALSSFDKPIILLLGGLDRGHSLNDLKPYLNQVKAIIGYGQTKRKVKALATEVSIPCWTVTNLKEAVTKAYQVSSLNDVILLSPACASWDQFKDFEERGIKFKEYIKKLKV